MTAPQRARRSIDPSVRGLLVLAVVVVLGLLLLAKAAPSSSTTIATRKNPGPTVSTAPRPTVTTRPTTTTPTTLGVPHAAAQVKVLVLNGTGGKVAKAAGTKSAKIKAKGYDTLDPGNAVAIPKSAVFFAPGYQADAAAVAKALTIAATAVVPVPSPPPAPNASQANVIVLLGQDTPA